MFDMLASKIGEAQAFADDLAANLDVINMDRSVVGDNHPSALEHPSFRRVVLAPTTGMPRLFDERHFSISVMRSFFFMTQFAENRTRSAHCGCVIPGSTLGTPQNLQNCNKNASTAVVYP